jgi:DNA-binding transcriptional regulator YiaG
MSKEEILAVRKGLRLTQDQFAVRVGVSRRTVVRWEDGGVAPHKVFVERVKDVRDGKR